jgi:mRNA interferase MazF
MKMRGDVYELRDNPRATGHEHGGQRYAIVLQSDALPMSTVIAAPTSTSARDASHRPVIELRGRRTKVVIEQMHGVDRERRFGRRVGQVSVAEQFEIDDALEMVLGLF